MRTWGRYPGANGGPPIWYEVTTDPNTGLNDLVYATTLIQTLLLNLGESPFYANVGIPAAQSVIQQVFPDYYVALTQQNFAPYFASLTITRISNVTPTYVVRIITHQGIVITSTTSFVVPS